MDKANHMKLTENFTLAEFTRTSHAALQKANDSSAGAFLHNLLSLAKELEKIREHFARPVFVTSGYRCPALNAAVGGANMSQHLVGAAADFVVKDFQDLDGLKLVFEWARKNCSFSQLILEAPAGGRAPWIHLGLPEALRGKNQQALFWNGEKYEVVA